MNVSTVRVFFEYQNPLPGAIPNSFDFLLEKFNYWESYKEPTAAGTRYIEIKDLRAFINLIRTEGGILTPEGDVFIPFNSITYITAW